MEWNMLAALHGADCIMGPGGGSSHGLVTEPPLRDKETLDKTYGKRFWKSESDWQFVAPTQ